MTHAIVVGCGNIGSHLIPHLARLEGITSVTLIDPDDYEQKNMTGQSIDSCDVGKPKSCVQASHLKRINPDLQVTALISSVENLPLGNLRGKVIFGCVDSRRVRMHLNEVAWRLGIIYVDAGVDPEGMLVRIDALKPGDDRPCMECCWTDRDYESLESSYPCLGNQVLRPTNAPSGLGALAASLQLIEAQKILSGNTGGGWQTVMDALHNKYYPATLRRNPRCRFDHKTWQIDTLHLSLTKWTLGDLLRLAPAPQSETGACSLGVEGMPFVRTLVCPGCGHSKSVLRLKCSLSVQDSICSFCRRRLLPSGWELAEELTSHLPARVLSRSLRSLGLRNGEVIMLGNDLNGAHFQIVADEQRTRESNSGTESGQRSSDGLGRIAMGGVNDNV